MTATYFHDQPQPTEPAREIAAPNIAIERLQRDPTTADAEWVTTWGPQWPCGPAWPTSFNTLHDAISAALREADRTLLIHRVLHDGDVVWASDGMQ